MLARLRRPWPDTRAERLLGAVSCLLGVLVVGMIVFVAVHALAELRAQRAELVRVRRKPGIVLPGDAGRGPPPARLRLPPACLAAAVRHAADDGRSRSLFAFVVSLFASIFIVELAPERLRRITIPVIRLLASVPSVVYGLIGVLVLVPFVGNHLVTAAQKESVASTIELTGAGLLVTVVILTLMIAPIMIALTCEALASVPNSWREGAIALGLNPLRAIMAVTVRAARPAIVAAAVLATAQGAGRGDHDLDGLRLEAPSRPTSNTGCWSSCTRRCAPSPPRSSTSVRGSALRRWSSSLYAFALLLLLGGFVLSVCGYLIKLPLRKYQVRG